MDTLGGWEKCGGRVPGARLLISFKHYNENVCNTIKTQNISMKYVNTSKKMFVTHSRLKIAEWSIPKIMLMLTFPKHYKEDKCIKESLNQKCEAILSL